MDEMKTTHTENNLYDGYVCLEAARYVELLQKETKLDMLCKLLDESAQSYGVIDYDKIVMLNTLFNKGGAK